MSARSPAAAAGCCRGHYVASKGAVGALVRWFARKGAPRNVLVNGAAPGPVDTGMIAGRDLNLAVVPLGRVARPEEIASTIALMFASGELRLRRHARCQRRGLHGIAAHRQPSAAPAQHVREKVKFGFRKEMRKQGI